MVFHGAKDSPAFIVWLSAIFPGFNQSLPKFRGKHKNHLFAVGPIAGHGRIVTYCSYAASNSIGQVVRRAHMPVVIYIHALIEWVDGCFAYFR